MTNRRRNGDRRAESEAIKLPPRLPQNERELEACIRLLGNRKRTELTGRAREELSTLLGAYPTREEATVWKRVLRRACQKAAGNA